MAFAIRESRYISGDTKRKYALLLILIKGLVWLNRRYKKGQPCITWLALIACG